MIAKDLVKYCQRVAAVTGGRLVSQSIVVGCLYIFSKVHKEAAEIYITALLRGESIDSSHSAYHVRNKLITLKLTKLQKIEVIFKGFIAYLKEKPHYSNRDITIPSIKFMQGFVKNGT